jgi:CheY-like chemotaxis protein
LLDISSIEAGRLRLEKSRQAVRRMLKEALAVWEPQAAQKSLAIDCEVSNADELDLDCDPSRILQVLNNLVGNAIKFTEPGGSIHVRVEHAWTKSVFSVTDSGPGIPEADLPHIFERFTQGQQDARQGTGLGLSIAKGIVETHGGALLGGKSGGRGEHVSISLCRSSLPRQESQRAGPSTTERDMSPGRTRRPIQQNLLKKVVLVVDDDVDCREMVAAVLEQEGYDVVSLRNGDEALEYLRHASRHPSCILLDLANARYRRLDVSPERNSNPDLETIPVIVLSGQPDDRGTGHCRTSSYLQKPLSPEHLTE